MINCFLKILIIAGTRTYRGVKMVPRYLVDWAERTLARRQDIPIDRFERSARSHSHEMDRRQHAQDVMRRHDATFRKLAK